MPQTKKNKQTKNINVATSRFIFLQFAHAVPSNHCYIILSEGNEVERLGKNKPDSNFTEKHVHGCYKFWQPKQRS